MGHNVPPDPEAVDEARIRIRAAGALIDAAIIDAAPVELELAALDLLRDADARLARAVETRSRLRSVA